MLEKLWKSISFKTEIHLICFIILLFIFRNAIPFFKYPFLLLLIYTTLYAYIKTRNSFRVNITDFIRNFIIIHILIFVLVISFLLSNKLYLTTFKDVFSAILLMFILFLMKLLINTKEEIKYFKNSLNDLIIYFALLISIVGLCNTFNIFSDAQAFPSGEDFSKVEIYGKDNNFALLPIFFGIIIILNNLLKSVSKSKICFYNILLIIYSISIFLSGSRRGLMILFGIIFVLVISYLYSFYKKNILFKNLFRNTFFYPIILVVLSISFYFIVLNTSYLFKTKTLEIIGSRNINATKQRVAFLVYRYNSLVNFKGTYEEFYNSIWSASLDLSDKNSSYDPKNPESIWGTRIHKTIFPLTGENVGIIPLGTKGYLMDSTCNSDTWNNNAYSYTLIGKSLVNENDSIKASVYCYVSEDFDGEWAILYASQAAIGECDYNLNYKGKWQKLSINLKCTKGEVTVHLYFSKFGVTNFSSLKGYVIFAYPIVEVVKQKGNTLLNNKYMYKLNDKVYKYNDNLIYYNIIYTNCIFIDKNLHTYYKNSLFSKIKCNSFSLPIPLNFIINNTSQDSDPIRKWISRFISEDTTYYGYKANIVIDSISNRLIDQRIERWQFAWQIFTKEYSWPKRIFGGGFNFLNWYGSYFLKDKTKSDYPHNPFLYILLYSGIIGLLLYTYLMYKVFYYYIKYVKEYYLFFIFFLISYFFTFFSGGNPFDPPIMGFFIILPFFIHYIHAREEIIE